MQDYWGYQNKVCVITGAASGMAQAAAKMLVDLGASVYALDVNEAAVAGLKAFIKTDLSKPESIDAAFAQIPGKIDNFFGVAGLTGKSTDYTTTFMVNFTANKYITRRYLLDRMGEGGSIGFISSTSGLRYERPEWRDSFIDFVNAENWEAVVRLIEEKGLKDLAGMMAYAPSKRALNYFSAGLATELGPRKIRVNTVLPGSTNTGMTPDFVETLGSMERLVQYAGFAGRLATPEEMAAPLVFLGSRMASYISGLDVVADFALNTGMILGQRPDMFAPRK
jgi:NAD(P)-dependent dehydrogenase (short-subunit alcohol dehydrogenase family)